MEAPERSPDEFGALSLDASDWATEAAVSDLRPHRVVEGEAEWTHGYARDEHVARTVRVRKILLWGALAWLSFLITDISFNAMRGYDSGPMFMVVRVLATLPVLGFWWRLGRSPAIGPLPASRRSDSTRPSRSLISRRAWAATESSWVTTIRVCPRA